MGMCLLATNLILSPEFHFRYEKVPLICRRLLMPIGDDHGNVKGYFIPLTDFGKASKMTLDGAMHVRIFRPDLVIMFQFLEAATRKMVTCNAMVNAQNGMNTWQTIRRLNRLFCGQRLVSSYDAKPPSGDFTMPVLCSLPYVQKRLKTQLPSQLRRTMAERYLTTHIPRCRTSADISDCIAELARIMESNSRNIILNYTNFVLNSRICLKTPIEKEEGVLKDGLMDFIATRARPNMFYQFEHVMGRMQEAFPGIGKKDIERLQSNVPLQEQGRVSQKELCLSRDYVGQKPIFYHKDGKKLIFSSQLNGLFKYKNEFELSKENYNLYLRFSHFPAPLTLYKKVFQVMPGEKILFSNKNIYKKKYWSLENGGDYNFFFKKNKKIKHIFERDIKKFLIADKDVVLGLSS